jgi:hypothetical protein
MKSRKQVEIQKINLLAERRYFESKFLNEDIKYQLSPIDSDYLKIEVIDTTDPEKIVKRDLNDEEKKQLDLKKQEENKFLKDDNEQQKKALDIIQNLTKKIK